MQDPSPPPMPDPMPDHPVQRATDYSKLARAADRWRLYQPLVTLIWMIAVPVFIWVQRQALLPTEVEQLRLRVDVLERTDSSATATSATRVAALEAKLNVALLQQAAILRAVCVQLTPRERELVACPGTGYGASGFGMAVPEIPAAPFPSPPTRLAFLPSPGAYVTEQPPPPAPAGP